MAESVYILIPIIYAVLNAVSFALYGMDKFKAKRNKSGCLITILNSTIG